MILTGDFNTDDATELSAIVSAGMRRLEPAPTYPSWKPRLALDHLFASPDIDVERLAAPPSLRLSDHAPVLAAVRLARSP
jgi:endonuclease/exonuclease/phosphatase family metal-dependent hydrolase